MGQKPSQQLAVEESRNVLSVYKVASGPIVHAAQKLKAYLEFEDPLSNLCPAPNTPNEIFLIHFITFCQERGADGWLTTAKMTKHQALLFGETGLGPSGDPKGNKASAGSTDSADVFSVSWGI